MSLDTLPYIDFDVQMFHHVLDLREPQMPRPHFPIRRRDDLLNYQIYSLRKVQIQREC